MIRDDERPLSEDVRVRVDEARLGRQWSEISRRVARAPRRRLVMAMLVPGALAVVVTVALLIARPWHGDRGPSTGVSAVAPTESLLLPDGSRIALSHGAELGIRSATRERVELTLDEGTIDLDVTHVDGRPFVVSAAGHAITVLGTAFTVSVEPRNGKRALSVEVKRGRVRVSGPSGDRVLDAGQSWSTTFDGPAVAPEAGAQPTIAGSGALGSATTEAPTDSTDAADVPSPSAVATPRVAPPIVESPKELLARATEARSAGRSRDAASALDTLRKRYRSDARAGLAAFELGRLRLDALNDPAGAAEAFADAVALSPSAPFREDAEARRVEAFDRLPDRGRCERARDAYLAQYPTGLHARRTAQRCKAP